MSPWVGCPRLWFFDFRWKTEYLMKYIEFPGIVTVEVGGIPRNFADFRAFLHTEFHSYFMDPCTETALHKNHHGRSAVAPYGALTPIVHCRILISQLAVWPGIYCYLSSVSNWFGYTVVKEKKYSYSYSYTCVDKRILCCSGQWKYLHYRGLSCTWTCQQNMCLNCTWACLDNRNLWWSGHVYTIGAWAASGRLYTTEAFAAPGRVYTIRFLAAPGLVWTKGALADPGCVYTTGAWAAPGRVCSTGALADPGRTLKGLELHMDIFVDYSSLCCSWTSVTL
jgi:hypothetical protein